MRATKIYHVLPDVFTSTITVLRKNLFLWQWASKTIKTKHSLHPTFTHGSSLGLYEVLNEKSYICDMITDSVVLCFFIEAEKIRMLLRSDPAIVDFLWQVCSLLKSLNIFV